MMRNDYRRATATDRKAVPKARSGTGSSAVTIAVWRKGPRRLRTAPEALDGRPIYLEGSLQSVAPEKSLSPMTPTRIKSKQHTRPAFGLSPKNAIPMIAVPAVPMPTKAA